MTELEFAALFTRFPQLECVADDEGAWFRWSGLPFYENNPELGMRFSGNRIRDLTPEELAKEVKRGFDVEQITRITGYFTRVNQWNKGKLGELKDRYRNDGSFGGAGQVPPPRPWAMASNKEANLAS